MHKLYISYKVMSNYVKFNYNLYFC